MERFLFIPLALVLLAACGEPAPTGLGEPLRIASGAFKEGELPGTRPKGSATDDKFKPQVTAVVSLPAVLRPLATDVPFEARASKDAYAIGIRFTKLGSGYWVFPLGDPDVVNGGELSWRVTANIGADVPVGEHEIELVAFDANGHAGLIRTRTVCITHPFDDNLNSCDPTLAPPARVISLSWSTDVDLDLVLRTPTGKLVDAKHPSTASTDAGLPIDTETEGNGSFDRDSNANCRIDSVRRESVIWQDDPEPGEYAVYANLFDACGRSSAQFELESYARADGKDDGTYRLRASFEPVRGEVLAASANGGARQGTLIAKIHLP